MRRLTTEVSGEMLKTWVSAYFGFEIPRWVFPNPVPPTTQELLLSLAVPTVIACIPLMSSKDRG